MTISKYSNSWLVTMSSEWGCELNDVDHEWHDEALCRGLGPDLFFFERGDNYATMKESKAICAVCPVKARCLEYAMANNIIHGIWGGTTAVERRALSQRRNDRLTDTKIAIARTVRGYKRGNHPSPVATTASQYGVSKATVHRAVVAVEMYENDTGEIIA